MAKRILLACAAGMSTSILVANMKKVAAEKGKDYVIWATAVDSIPDEEDGFDCILVGPQMAKRLDEIEEFAEEFSGHRNGVPVEIIPKENYGKINGAAVLEQAEKLLGE